ncbi:MAG: hypothetical protein SFY56_16055 [Bacteroidota bacterium]|nr:hypothetical protein [Bacteroidota bacterium]
MDNNLENNNKNNEQTKFGLPEGYFQKSASSIFNKIEWQEEHKEFVNLLNHKNKTGFIIPENYFSKTESKLELLEFEKLGSLGKNNPFKVPENYFDEDVLKLVTLGEVEVDSELNEYKILASLKKQNCFAVPENYFETVAKRTVTLSGAEVASNNSATKTKVINLFSPKMWYSVAALLVIAVGLWMYNSYYKTAELKDCGTLACVDKIDLVKAKHLENIETEELYKLVNTKKLEDNLEKKSNTTQNKNDALDSVSTDDLMDEL